MKMYEMRGKKYWDDEENVRKLTFRVKRNEMEKKMYQIGNVKKKKRK